VPGHRVVMALERGAGDIRRRRVARDELSEIQGIQEAVLSG